MIACGTLCEKSSNSLPSCLSFPVRETRVKEAKPKAEALIAEISRELEQARHEAELSSFETGEPQVREGVSLGYLEAVFSSAEHVLALATSLTRDSVWQEWQHMPSDAQKAESELRNAIARRIKGAATGDSAEDANDNLSKAAARWTNTIQRLSLEGTRISLVSQIADEAQYLGGQVPIASQLARQPAE